MGFRNPVLTAVDPVARDTADQALTEATTGIIPGTRLAADAIDGKTVTGATLQTAKTGARIVIDSVEQDRVHFYSGATAEAAPGRIYGSWTPGETSSGKDQGSLYLAPPQVGTTVAVPETGISILGQTRDQASRGQIIVTGPMTVDTPTLPAAAAPKSYVDGTKVFPAYAAGWGPYTAESFEPLQFWRIGSTVYASGCVVKDTTTTSPDDVCTLPAGMRPRTYTPHHITEQAATVRRLDTGPLGAFRLVGASGIAAGRWFRISLCFRIDN